MNRTRRDAVIRNLHQLGCTHAAIAEGFGLSRVNVARIAARRDWRNPCTHHKIVLASCRDCKRESVGTE